MEALIENALREAVEKADAPALLRDLVRAPSHPGVERREERVAQALASYLRGAGVETALEEVRPGRPNLVARLAGTGGGRALLLCGHTDTVAPDPASPVDPFAAESRDGRLHGRGACDMKGGLAAMAAALAALARSRGRLRGDVALAAVIDEELESLGAEHLIRSGVSADGCAVGEPTGNRVAIAHRGQEWLEIEITGRAAHAGGREPGISAVEAAARFVRLVAEDLRPALERRTHPLLGSASVQVGLIRGGEHPSTVPARCTLQVDRRWIPGERVEGVFSEIEDLLARVRAGTPGLSTTLRRAPGGMATMAHGPLETPPDHPLVTCALEARRAACGRADAAMGFPAWTDAALLSREAGIPCVVMGPGSLAQAHAADEWVALDQVREAALQYAALALRFCGAP